MTKSDKLLHEVSRRQQALERRLYLLKTVFTIQEAALYMGCSSAKVRLLMEGSKPALKSYSPNGKLRYIKRKDLENYLLGIRAR